MSDYPAPSPHGPIEQLFDDVFWVQGSIRMGPGMSISRNMVVLRHDGALTLLNPLRLSAAGEAELGRLGEVANAVRLGYYHGLDDRYYVDKLGATFWCQAGSDHYPEPEPEQVIEPGTELPVPDTELFIFEQTLKPECAVLLERHGGLLVTCDSVQHHVDSSNCSLVAKLVMRLMGFMKPANIGPPWRKSMTPEGGSLRADFERLLTLEFDLLVGAHGTVCRSGAHAALEETVRRVFA